jgi:CBS domain-containing membrane protein
MIAIRENLLALKAAHLMSEALVVIPQEMSLQGAAHLLVQARVSGAPVVDKAGRCVGVLSAADFVRWADKEKCACHAGREHTYCSSWQIPDIEELPSDSIENYMTPDPVVSSKGTSIADLARMMVDAHIHRVIVVDANQRPVGVVSSTDILAAVARAGRPM